jgi:hypothetical protein
MDCCLLAASVTRKMTPVGGACCVEAPVRSEQASATLDSVRTGWYGFGQKVNCHRQLISNPNSSEGQVIMPATAI